jgi:hypothetical protein
MAPRDLANTYKLMGICQFMQNNRNGATQSFKMALANDPNTAVSASEVLDEGVIGFFNKIRASAPKSSAVATRKAPTSPGTMKMAARRTTDAKGNPLKQTFLIINSTNKGANVFIDGIIAGQVNSRINTSPGKVLVEVAQPGFKPKKVRISITKDSDNAVTINLDKIQPKAPPRPKAPPAPPDDDLGIAVAAGARGAKSKAGAKPARTAKPRGGAPRDDLFGEAQVAQAPPVQSGPRIAQAPGQMPAMPQQQPQPMMAQGYPGQPGYPMPGYGTMAYPQQQASPYPPPGYYPPAYYPQPPQVIIQQAPPSYYGAPDMSPSPMSSSEPLPPPPSIEGDPVGGGGTFDGGGSGGLPPEPSVSPDSLGDPGFGSGPSGGSRGRSGGGSSGRNNANIGLYLLPLGVGQFVNGRPLLGTFFLGAQAGSAIFGFINYQTAEKRTKEINDFQTNNCTDDSSEADIVACEEYVQAGRANVATLKQYNLYGFIGAGAAYGLSVIQAFLDTPTKTAKKKKRRGFSLNESPSVETVSDSTGGSTGEITGEITGESTYGDEIADDSGFKWRFDIAPHYNGVRSTVEPALTLNMDWRF